MDMTVGGPIGLLILIANIWAIITILGTGASTGNKILWIVIILLLPVIGLILWWFLGPKKA